MDIRKKKIIQTLVLVLLALISLLLLSKFLSSADTYKGTIAELDDKRTTVLELTAVSTTASAAITLIPGDAATPIAEKLADFSSYFLIVLCAIMLEKYLLTVIGYGVSVILIPLICILFIVYIWRRNDSLLPIAKKLIAFSIAIMLVVPGSVKVANLIETTYQDSIDQTISSAKEVTKEVDKSTEEDDDGVLSWIESKVSTGFSDIKDKVENVLNDFLEALAVLLVTSCLIPILVLFFFFWLVKMLFAYQGDIPLPHRRQKSQITEKKMLDR